MIVFIVIILAMIGVFSLRLYKTQAAVTEESLVTADADSMTYQSTVEAARGNILDRNGIAAYDQIKNPQPRTNTQQRQYQDDPFADWYRQGYQQSWAQTDPMEAARRYIFVQEYERALRELQTVPEAQRTAQWYYFAAVANTNLGNRVLGYEQITRACAMDPTNAEYAAAREQIGRSGTAYHDRQTGFGFEGVDLNRTCCGLCAALQFLSCLFGGRGCPVILCC